MNIGIIGAGNMGGAIAQGLLNSHKVEAAQLYLADKNQQALAPFVAQGVQCYSSSIDVAQAADVLIVAVKPWIALDIISEANKHLKPGSILASVVAGLSLPDIQAQTGKKFTLFRIVPNTAAAIGQSMTFVSTHYANPEEVALIKHIFAAVGQVMVVDEDKVPAVTALTSCGIAYAMKYISANMRAAVEIGIPAQEAKAMMIQTLAGAAELLRANETSHPEVEIDRVATPGGITIKGINALEAAGFTSAVINAIKASSR